MTCKRKESWKLIHNSLILKVPEEGVEPSRSEEHMALNHACLPIPAPGRKVQNYKNILDFWVAYWQAIVGCKTKQSLVTV